MRHLLVALTLLPALAAAAPADATWRTVQTEHFRLHYPLAAEPWSLQAAQRLEAMHGRVEAQVGRTHERLIDVVVRDPVSDSNGMALPFLRRPTIELWVTPPDATSVIGWNRRWDEGLIVHEDAHIVHLAWPARGGSDRLLDRITGFGPLVRKAPRWIMEGYATLVEGEQTGFGRPYSARISADLRRLATEGRLPAYEDLDGGGAWGAGGFAYWVGAAYLRWLVERGGPESLEHLWRRMTAVTPRSFDDAFTGVFGASPPVLYARFTAEVTADAMALERARPTEPGTRHLDTYGTVTSYDLSPDGARLVVATSEPRWQLQVWTTEQDDTARSEARDTEVAYLLERDPLDIPDVLDPDPELEQVAVRRRRDRGPTAPRWLDDQRVLFTGRTVDRKGRVRTDLFVWDVEGGERRITHNADVRDADPAPDGTWAVAIQHDWGVTRLVRVDLQTGDVTALDPGDAVRVVDGPRVSPDGQRIAWLEMHDGAWQIRVRDLFGQANAWPTPEIANLASLSWHPDGDDLLVSFGAPQWMEVARITPEGDLAVLTRSHGGAMLPEATATHLYWRDADADGHEIHRVALDRTLDPVGAWPFAPLASTPFPTPVEPLAPVDVVPHPYGLGRTHARGLASGVVSRDVARAEVGLRLGDGIGRHEALILAGVGTGADGRDVGGLATGVVRALPVDLHGQAFIGGTLTPDTGAIWGGGEVGVSDHHRWGWGVLRGEVSLGAGQGVASFWTASTVALDVQERRQRLADLHLEGRLTTWGDKPIVDARMRADLLRGWVSLGADGLLGQGVSAGGGRSAVIPTSWQAGRWLHPGLPDGALAGDQLLALDGALGADGGPFFTHLTTGDTSTSLTGLRARYRGAAEPLARLPAIDLEGGVACRIPGDVTGTPCDRLDDWTAWLSATWRVSSRSPGTSR